VIDLDNVSKWVVARYDFDATKSVSERKKRKIVCNYKPNVFDRNLMIV
jgi:hypothetical protein